MIPRGSVALNGVSLTLASLETGAFSVALIPVTLAGTNLGELRPGRKVNIETDLIGKYVSKMLTTGKGEGITMETLVKYGFV
jgi:riboflavin synthase